MPENLFTFTPSEYSSAVIVFNLAISLAISLLIAWVYKQTHSGLSYSQSFLTTLVLIGVITTVVIMAVQNNIFGALGLLGAFALIRFRTIVKETRDISFVFFTLAEGVAIGTGNYPLALVSTVFICAAAYMLHVTKFGSVSGGGYILILSSGEPLEGTEFYKTLEGKRLYIRLLNTKRAGDKEFEYTFSLRAKDEGTVGEYLNVLNSMRYIKTYDFISGRDTGEY